MDAETRFDVHRKKRHPEPFTKRWKTSCGLYLRFCRDLLVASELFDVGLSPYTGCPSVQTASELSMTNLHSQLFISRTAPLSGADHHCSRPSSLRKEDALGGMCTPAITRVTRKAEPESRRSTILQPCKEDGMQYLCSELLNSYGSLLNSFVAKGALLPRTCFGESCLPWKADFWQVCFNPA